MALRTFHANPQVGGFGGESSGTPAVSLLRDAGDADGGKRATPLVVGHPDGDAFCQIVKELVDNAVDACALSMKREAAADSQKASATKGSTDPDKPPSGNNRRVKVEIRPYNPHDKNDDDQNETPNDSHESSADHRHQNQVLQVTVSDNGCGMGDIQKCVNAFQTSKGNTSSAGRYGIGLTLCLVHGQRLIPNSYACITSATATARSITRAFFVVNTQKDKVVCHKKEKIVKTNNKESGTCVSLLVPGGSCAQQAWPRLIKYFSRFQLLGSGLPCRLEIFAPTLSRTPIFIRGSNAAPTLHRDSVGQKPHVDTSELLGVHTMHGLRSGDRHHGQTSELQWTDAFQDDGEDSSSVVQESLDTAVTKRRDDRVHQKHHERRAQVLQAVSAYLNRPLNIETKNVAHSKQPIRMPSNARAEQQNGNTNHSTNADVDATTTSNNSTDQESAPQLHVDMVVCGSADAINDENDSPDDSMARLEVIRLVNGIPLMDGAEAVACGLLRGIHKKSLWGSFGLNVVPLAAAENEAGRSVVAQESAELSFEIHDSDQVLPFLRGTECSELGNTGSIRETEMIRPSLSRTKRKRSGTAEYADAQLMPAKVRLGLVVVIVHLHAKPSMLPLPTLSKGRLPLNHAPILNALQNALRECLKSIQTTNPDLLFTAQQLRKVERESRYVPAVAWAISRVMLNSKNRPFQSHALSTVWKWQNSSHRRGSGRHLSHDDESKDEEKLSSIIDSRLLSSLKGTERSRKAARKVNRSSKGQPEAVPPIEHHYEEIDSPERRKTDIITKPEDDGMIASFLKDSPKTTISDDSSIASIDRGYDDVWGPEESAV